MTKSNKMAQMPVKKLMLNMGVPMIISMMLQAVYNIVDSAFVANMEGTGEMALNALTLAFPVQMLMVAIGIGTGVGVNALLARCMGQGDMEKAAKTAGNGIFLVTVIYVVFLVFGLFGTEIYISSQTKNPVIAEMAIKYIRICCCLSFGILYFSLYEKVLQATGKSMYSTIAQISGAVVNIILDPIMIYGLFGCPKLGVDGAAYATVIGQIVSALIAVILHLKANKEIKNGISYIRPETSIIKGIYSIGFAAIIAQALMSVMTYLLNVIFVRIGNGIFLVTVIYVVFLVFGLFGTEIYISSQTKNPVIAEMAIKYIRICCCLSFGILYFSLYEKVLQATGKSMYSTIAQISGAVVNIILDPIMIYGLFGCPKLGVDGAAYATVIGQIVSALIAVILHLKANKEIKNGISYIRPETSIIKGIYSIGFAAIIAQALMSVMTYLLNVIFVRIGENVVTAYGLYYKIQQFMLFAAFGLRDAITPIVSFNYGMGSKERVKDGIKYGLIYTLIIMVIGFAGLEIFAEPFAAIFGLSGETKKLCISAMRIVSTSYMFAGANIAFQGIFQALDCGKESFVVSVCRQFLFVIPVAFIFTQMVVSGMCGEWLIWVTFLIAEGLSMILSIIFMKRMMRNI